MSIINNSIYICDFIGCNKYLKEPITLPCGETVCREHVNDTSATFKCPVCEQDFIIPEEGFKINKKINTFINENSHLNGQHRELKDMFDKLERIIENFQKSNLANPQLYIYDYFAAIRNKIDLHREKMIESIHKRSEELINKLNTIEHECYKNEQKLEKIDLKKDEMNHLSEKLRENNLETNEFVNMKKKVNDKIKTIKTTIKSYENSILLNNSIKFEAKNLIELGNIIVTNKNNHFELYEDSGKLIKTFEGHSDWVYCIEQIEDFSKIITCSYDKTIKIWSTESGECLKTLTGHTDLVESLTISNDKKYLISGSCDETIKVWNIETDFELVQTLQLENGVGSMCLLPNNILVCGLGNGKISKWNLNNFTELDSFKAHDDFIWNIKHVSSSQIASCSKDKIIKFWDLEKNKCLMTFTGHGDRILCLEISLDKSKLYSGSSDYSLRVWDITSGECLNSINLNGLVLSLKLLSFNYIAVGLSGKKENLKIIDLNSFKIIKSIKTNSEFVKSLNFNRNKNELFVGSYNGPIRMFQF
jgi:WD40 repeat protein